LSATVKWLVLVFFLTGPAYAQTPRQPVIQGCVSLSLSCAKKVFNTGDILIVGASWESAVVAPSVADTFGTSFTTITSNLGAGCVKGAIFVGISAGNGTDTITVTEAGAGFSHIAWIEVPPLWSTTADDFKNAQFSGLVGTSNISAPAMTTTKNGDFVYAYAGGCQSGGVFAPVPNLLPLGGVGGADSSYNAFLLSAAPGSYTSTFTTTVNSEATILTIALPPSAITITSDARAPDGGLSTAYSYQLLAIGGTSAYTWSITSGALQTGLSLNASTGTISGTPTFSSQNNITFRVTDGTVNTTKVVTLKIGGSLNVATVAHTMTCGNGGLSCPRTLTVDNIGDAIIVATGVGSPGVSNCSDSFGTHFDVIKTDGFNYTQNFTAVFTGSIVAGISAGSGADTLSCDLVGSAFIALDVHNVMYVASDNVVLTDGGHGGGVSGTMTSSSLTTLVPNELLVALPFCESSGTCTITPSTFTYVPSAVGYDLDYKLSTTVGGYTYVATYVANNTGPSWAIILAGFRPSGGAVVSSVNPRHSMIM
jgi:hypothetical protein